MNLIRRTPQTPVFPRFDTSFLREFENLAENLPRYVAPFIGKETMTVAEWAPLVDIQETEKEYLFKVELPEIDPKKVKLTIQENVLAIEGEREAEKEEKNKKLHRIERSYGKFVRTFTVPVDAEETKVAAEFKEGMLYIHLPKTDKARPKTIEVKVVS